MEFMYGRAFKVFSAELELFGLIWWKLCIQTQFIIDFLFWSNESSPFQLHNGTLSSPLCLSLGKDTHNPNLV